MCSMGVVRGVRGRSAAANVQRVRKTELLESTWGGVSMYKGR